MVINIKKNKGMEKKDDFEVLFEELKQKQKEILLKYGEVMNTADCQKVADRTDSSQMTVWKYIKQPGYLPNMKYAFRLEKECKRVLTEKVEKEESTYRELAAQISKLV